MGSMRLLLGLFTILVLFEGCSQNTSSSKLQSDSIAVSRAFSAGEPVGILNIDELNEASGLANSRSNPDYLWSHNDSGGAPALYLISFAGQQMARYFLAGVSNYDWEDLAIGPGPIEDRPYLYIGDIGDNWSTRDQYVIYRFLEPVIDSVIPSTDQQIEDFDIIRYVYEDGSRDAEALMVDPVSKNIYIVSKREDQVGLYRLGFPHKIDEVDTARKVATFPFNYVTAGDISSDGGEVLIKNYLNVYYWKKKEAESIEDLLNTAPLRLVYTPETQGESIAWKADASAYMTLSEKAQAEKVEILLYQRN